MLDYEVRHQHENPPPRVTRAAVYQVGIMSRWGGGDKGLLSSELCHASCWEVSLRGKARLAADAAAVGAPRCKAGKRKPRFLERGTPKHTAHTTLRTVMHATLVCRDTSPQAAYV